VFILQNLLSYNKCRNTEGLESYIIWYTKVLYWSGFVQQVALLDRFKLVIFTSEWSSVLCYTVSQLLEIIAVYMCMFHFDQTACHDKSNEFEIWLLLQTINVLVNISQQVHLVLSRDSKVWQMLFLISCSMFGWNVVNIYMNSKGAWQHSYSLYWNPGYIRVRSVAYTVI